LSEYRNILVIILKHIGDVLVATPVFTALKEAYPRSHLSVLVDRGTEDMVTLNPAVDEVIILDRAEDAPLFARFFRQAAFAVNLRRKRFDLVLELSAGDRGAFLGFFTGAPERIGFEPKKRTFLGRHHAFTRLVRISENGLCESEPYVVMHPTSRWLFKAWNSRGYASVCDYIAEKYGIPVVVTSAPDKKEKKRVEEIFSFVKSRQWPYSNQERLAVSAMRQRWLQRKQDQPMP